MSATSPTRVFESGLSSRPPSDAAPESGDLESLVRQKLDGIAMASESPTSPPLGGKYSNLLNDMGDYFLQTAANWALLTKDLTSGDHITKLSLDAHRQAQQESDLADLSGIVALDVDLSKLRKIRDMTAQYARDVQDTWRSGPSIDNNKTALSMAPVSSMNPFCGVNTSATPPQPVTSGDNGKPRRRRSLPVSSRRYLKAQVDQGSDSEGSDEEDEELFQKVDMAALSNRGKGNHVCPKRLRCTKGGVDKNGNLVSFERNSSFVQHCNKHRKPYRCTKDNCPNPLKKRKFARRDGLERHLNTVVHSPPTPEMPDMGLVKLEAS